MGEMLKEEHKKNYKVVSRIVGILMRIANVCCWIGVVALFSMSAAFAVISPNLKVNSDKKEITFFDKTINYDLKNQDFESSEGDSKIIIRDQTIEFSQDGSVFTAKLSESDIEKIEKFLESDLTKVFAVLPYVFAIAAISLIFTALMLGHGARVFKNIAKEKTPFTEENITRAEKAAKYLIISWVILIVANIIMGIAMGGTGTQIFQTGSIVSIFIVYVAVYVLKYGYDIESKKASKKTEE